MKDIYQSFIGIEVHVQLNTKSKMFTKIPYKYNSPVNTLIDPYVLGLPGSLPVINYDAILKAVKVGLLFKSNINTSFSWDRKNYFYPDLPKGYQISQNYSKICTGGFVKIELPLKNNNYIYKKINLHSIHLEEDVGKIIHQNEDSLIDLNRAGVTLLEIISKPEIKNAEEAFYFLKSLRNHLLCIGVSNCDLEKGEMRFDVNISLSKNKNQLGTKVEIKNLNSVFYVKESINYEINRQKKILLNNGSINQETLRWDEKNMITVPMRKKESSIDYRYFPDPDLPIINISKKMISDIKKQIPILPFDKKKILIKKYNLSNEISSLLSIDNELYKFFEETVQIYNNPIMIANFIINDIRKTLLLNNLKNNILPQNLAKIIKMVDEGLIYKQIAKQIILDILLKNLDSDNIINHYLSKNNINILKIKNICLEVVESNISIVDTIKSGKKNAINFLVGKVIKSLNYNVDANIIKKILEEII